MMNLINNKISVSNGTYYILGVKQKYLLCIVSYNKSFNFENRVAE